MGILEDLIKRAENSCELCKSLEDLEIFEVSPSDGTAEQSALLCPIILNVSSTWQTFLKVESSIYFVSLLFSNHLLT